MSDNILGDRIKERRLELEMTQGDVAKEIGVATSTIQRYETDSIGKIKLPVVEAIARVLRVSPDWLIGKSDEKEVQSISFFDFTSIPNLMPLPKTREVPRLGIIACGEPILARENIEDYDRAPEGVNCDFTPKCKGDSMAPTIQDGDLVAIRIQPEVENGEIAAVRIENEATLKRVYLHNDYIELRPDNMSHPSIIRRKNEMNDVHIEGKAVGLCRGL